MHLQKQILVAALAILLCAGGWRGYHGYRESRIMHQYQTYSSSNAAFDFVFKYPPDWTLKEFEGRTKNYDVIEVLGPRDADLAFTVGQAVTVQAYDTSRAVDELDLYIEKQSRLPKFKVLKRAPREVSDISTDFADLEYTMYLPLYKKGAREVTMKEQVFVVTKGNKQYRLSFLGTAEQFNEHLPVSRRMIKSFQFK